MVASHKGSWVAGTMIEAKKEHLTMHQGHGSQPECMTWITRISIDYVPVRKQDSISKGAYWRMSFPFLPYILAVALGGSTTVLTGGIVVNAQCTGEWAVRPIDDVPLAVPKQIGSIITVVDESTGSPLDNRGGRAMVKD